MRAGPAIITSIVLPPSGNGTRILNRGRHRCGRGPTATVIARPEGPWRSRKLTALPLAPTSGSRNSWI